MIKDLNTELQDRGKTNEEHDLELRAKKNYYNSTTGNVNNCPKCKGRGDFDKIIYDKYSGRAQSAAYVCPQCGGHPTAEKRIQQSDVASELKEMTFDSFNLDSDEARIMESQAHGFIRQLNSKEPQTFFYIGGSVGTGKTHLCMAMLNELANYRNFKTFWWYPDMSNLKAVKNTEEYSKRIEKLRTVEVLYIDDLLKTSKGKEATSADRETIGEILEDRYNKKRITIMSSEHTLGELGGIDEWLASRILERASKRFVIKAQGRNKRGGKQ